MNQSFLEGFLLQASLIFALGAQNLFVLESGVRRENPLAVSLTCFACDLVLIMTGVAGAATLFTIFPQIKVFIGIVGVFFLFYYGWKKIWDKCEIYSTSHAGRYSLKNSILKSITFSLINPHAYLDGIVLIGGFSAKYKFLSDRLAVGIGASLFSLMWFLLLTYASSYFIPFMKNPRRMRFVMSLAGFFLVYLSGKLSLEVYGWTLESESLSSMLSAMVF